jgi:hypothetical protein
MRKEDLPKGYMFDYRAGYVRAGTAMPGFDVYGGENAGQSVLALGGSEGWAKPLHGLHGPSGGDFRVYDGCADGHTTAQAMILLIRDGLLLKPDVAVCVSGYYNFAYRLGVGVSENDAEILRSHPFATPNHIRYYTAITERMGIGNGKIYYGAEVTAPAWETWAEHLKIMNVLCAEFGIRFAAFLQPNPRPGAPAGAGGAELAECFAKAAGLASQTPYITPLSPAASDPESIAREVRKALWND